MNQLACERNVQPETIKARVQNELETLDKISAILSEVCCAMYGPESAPADVSANVNCLRDAIALIGDKAQNILTMAEIIRTGL